MKFIHFQPVFFHKIGKKGLGLPTKITHEWLQTWRPSYHIIPDYLEFNGRNTSKL